MDVAFTGKIWESFRVAPHWQGRQCGRREEERSIDLYACRPREGHCKLCAGIGRAHKAKRLNLIWGSRRDPRANGEGESALAGA